jgi:uncharacterized membrane protein
MSATSRRSRFTGSLILSTGLLLATLSIGTAAQDSPTSADAGSSAAVRPTQLTLSTEYPSIIVAGGEEADFPLSVTGPVDERVDLRVEGAPDGYLTSVYGGDAVVSSVYTSAEGPPPLELRVRVPEDAPARDEALTLVATSTTGTTSLPLDVVVSDADPGVVALSTKYPVLSGDSDSSYSFDLTLDNGTAHDVTFGLQGSGPDGWTVDVRPSGEDKAATALVTAGGHTNIKVTAKPPRFAPVGKYVLGVTADGEGHTANANLGVEITGSYDLTLDTPDGRLNTSVAAGDSTPVAVLVSNTGTAPLTDVKLTASTPKGWNVTFDPEVVPAIDPTGTVQVQARVAPAGNAVAGDYAVTLKAAADSASGDLQLRTTVETSAMWGVAAIAVIALAGAGLLLVFRRYGRR